ncbi:MAG: D-ornithine 4,5-aminomutase subunit alpha [Thermotogaceae bacterium]|jgi:D-ornithine 4,5-aminomutase subunit alpha|nr:D-ornithine 4,5-aminomutase subunit alpha [Thermotogaceae bacterium]MDN5336979.1 D-ornithine 4,5-aminomutase subunit alpha [Thermotogaceae bacterium]
MQRPDDFEKRKKHLENMTDEELDRYFWELANKIVEPLIELAKTHTSPSIERSVLLRMGFNSLQAQELVKKIHEKGLLGKGAGNVVLSLAQKKKLNYIQAGEALIEGKYWDEVEDIFKGVDTR